MLNPVLRKNNRYYAYLNNMLNVVYLSGWVRQPNDNGFLLQQTNNIKHAIPVSFGDKSKIKTVKEFQKIKIIAHVFGERDENGLRSIRLDPIHSEVPTMLEMPMEDVFFTRSLRDGEDDDFKPFDKSFTKQVKSPDFVVDNFKNEALYQEVVNHNVRAEYQLNYNCNQAQVAGYLSGFKFRPGNGYEEDCLLLAVRQYRDDNRSIPVRLYGNRVRVYANLVRVGQRVQIQGSLIRQYKEVNATDGKSPPKIEAYTYIKTSDISTPEVGSGIKAEPDWIVEMLNDLRKEREERQKLINEAQMRQAAAEKSKNVSVAEMGMD